MKNLLPKQTKKYDIGSETTPWKDEFAGEIQTKKLNNKESVRSFQDGIGYLYAWGYNDSGQLGINNTISPYYTPQKVPFDGLVKYVAGTDATFILDEDNYLYSCGCNNYGQNGDGTQWGSHQKFKKISTTKWKKVVENYTSLSLGITEDGYLYGWGCNYYKLDIGFTSNSQYTPYKISNSKWNNIYFYESIHLFLDENNYLYSMGDSIYGTLLTGSTTGTQFTPLKVSDTKWKNIILEKYFIYLIDQEDSIYGCGNTQLLGLSSTSQIQYTPIKLNNTKWKLISTSWDLTLAINTDNYLYVWGSSNYSGDSENIHYTPFQIGTSKWKNIWSYNSANFAIDNDDYLYSWGYNGSGQLGQNSYSYYYYTPTKLSETKWKWIISSGIRTTYILDSNNNLYSFGNNNVGTCGDETSNNSIHLRPYKINIPKCIDIKTWCSASDAYSSFFVITDPKDA